MPTYQYACTECGHAFDQFQSFADDALTECPECQGRLRKVFNAVGVVFKGSGFYRNDSREKSAGSEPGKVSEKTKVDAGAAASTSASSSSDSSGASTSSSPSSPSTSDSGSSSSSTPPAAKSA